VEKWEEPRQQVGELEEVAGGRSSLPNNDPSASLRTILPDSLPSRMHPFFFQLIHPVTSRLFNRNHLHRFVNSEAIDLGPATRSQKKAMFDRDSLKPLRHL